MKIAVIQEKITMEATLCRKKTFDKVLELKPETEQEEKQLFALFECDSSCQPFRGNCVSGDVFITAAKTDAGMHYIIGF